MSVWGPLRVGRLTLTESPEAAGKTAAGGRAVAIAGQEACPPLASQAAARDRAEQLLAYRGAVVPCIWDDKPHLDGWYLVDSADADEVTWGTHTGIRWRADLIRVGGDSEIEIESRLIGGNRAKASSATAELWHAPAPGHDSYLVGSSTPGFVTRASQDGAVIAYRAVPAATNPRWSVPADVASAAAASVTVDGVLRAGLTCPDTPAAWVLSNGILRVEPRTSAGTLRVTSWLAGGSWGTTKVFDLKRGTTSLGAAQHVTILRNDACEVLLRLTWNHAPGRTTCDLSVKRGSRFVGVFLQQYAAPSALRVDDNAGGGTVTDQLAAAGYIASTTSDANSNRWVLGCTVAATAAGTFGLAANVAATRLSGYIGCVYGGASPAAGDTAAQVNSQYLGTPTEVERVILR